MGLVELIEHASALPSDLATILVYALATVAAAAILAAGRALFRMARSMKVVHEAVVGRPATDVLPAIPSMQQQFSGIGEHLRKQDDKLEKVEHEILENDGSSIKDAVVRVEQKLDDHIVQVADNQRTLLVSPKDQVERPRMRRV